MVLQRMLKAFGFETTESENALDAIWKLNRGEDITLITVDYNMPKMTGSQFVRVVREKPELKDVRILMITSENTTQRRDEALQAGANEFLVKPFTQEMIAEKLAVLGFQLNAASEANSETAKPDDPLAQ